MIWVSLIGEILLEELRFDSGFSCTSRTWLQNPRLFFCFFYCSCIGFSSMTIEWGGNSSYEFTMKELVSIRNSKFFLFIGDMGFDCSLSLSNSPIFSWSLSLICFCSLVPETFGGINWLMTRLENEGVILRLVWEGVIVRLNWKGIDEVMFDCSEEFLVVYYFKRLLVIETI